MGALVTVHGIIHALNDLSPLGLAAMLGAIIFLMVWKKGPLKQISDNHLSDLPKMATSLEKIVESSQRQEETLATIRDGINEVKGRLY